MNPPSKKISRCAIYTRKSTDHNLDLEFNSLDAQREACEAYIKSQAHEGWRLVPACYDDGAFSGASLDRPALQELLAQVRAGKVDTIVVYKVDRLTRSLADFAKLIELFDEHAVSFVSVTQSFNTTSSMGRLTLNVLLSFAQFEREVIGERVRDKIAASKRKGIWVGGPLPLGYRSVDKKLVVVPDEAETVRFIFRRYLELESLGSLLEELRHKRIRTRHRPGSKGRAAGGIEFRRGSLAYLLKNRFYIGEVAYRGELCLGDHEAIVDKAVFQEVQHKLATNAVDRQLRLRSSSALLAGRLFDELGYRMTPTHTNKKGVRYRYYLSHRLLQERTQQTNTVARVPAPEIEALAVSAIRKMLLERKLNLVPEDDRELIGTYLDRVTVQRDQLNIRVFTEATPALASEGGSKELKERSSTAMTVPRHRKGFPIAKGLLSSQMDKNGSPGPSRSQEALLLAIAKARHWIDLLVSRKVKSFAEIAAREGKVERHIRLLAPLALVSPQIVRELADGGMSHEITITGLAKGLPYSWATQRRRRSLGR